MDLLALSSSKFTILNRSVRNLASLIDLKKLGFWDELAIGFLRNGSGSCSLEDIKAYLRFDLDESNMLRRTAVFDRG